MEKARDELKASAEINMRLEYLRSWLKEFEEKALPHKDPKGDKETLTRNVEELNVRTPSVLCR